MTNLLRLFILTVLANAAFTTVNAQNTNSSDAQDIKQRKMIIALAEYPKKASAEDKEYIDQANQSLQEAMENYWTFNEIKGVMSLDEAKDAVKKDKSLCYITIEEGEVVSSTVRNTQYITYGEQLAIYAPGKKASLFLPRYEGKMTKATATYAVMQMGRIFDLLDRKVIKSILGSGKYVKENGPNIINKTLLIPKEYVSDKLSLDDIKLYYPYDLELATLEKVEAAILNKDSKYAVAYYVLMPVSTKYIHRVYISNAEDGDIYGVMDGSKMSVDLGILGTTDKKDFLINERELKQLAKLVD